MSIPTGPISGAIAFLGGIRATVFACVAGVALTATCVQTWRADRKQDRIDTLTGASALWAQANRDNTQAISKLRAANAEWSQKCRADPVASQEAATAAEANRDALPADDQRRQEERARMYEHEPSAADWGRQRVPVSLADRLRR